MNSLFQKAILALGFIVVSLTTTLAQTPKPGPSYVVVVVHYRLFGDFRGLIDSGGQTINGLSEKQLNEKFKKVPSAANIVNFVSQAGYRAVGFSTVPGGVGAGTGGGMNGITILMEKIE